MDEPNDHFFDRLEAIERTHLAFINLMNQIKDAKDPEVIGMTKFYMRYICNTLPRRPKAVVLNLVEPIHE